MECETRMTSQRIKILDYLMGVKTHPNAEQVYNHVKKDLPSISLATVYRNLNLLAQQGKILKFEVNGEARFDADTGCHQHFVCRNCNKIIDLCKEEISRFAMKMGKSKEFTPDTVKIIFLGLCKECKR